MCFFATSLEKQPCNGIGVTVKELVSNASLQCINDTQIPNPHNMLQYCKNNIQGIFITKDELIKIQGSLKYRCAKVITVLGTRSYHEFIPLSENTIALKYSRKDQEVATTLFFSNEEKVNDAVNSNKEWSKNFKALDFVSCYYNNYLWISLALEKYDLQEDSCNDLCGLLSKKLYVVTEM